MDGIELGEVIAIRKLALQTKEGESSVKVSVGKPRPFGDFFDYYCPYRIEGLGNEINMRACGIDAIQALRLALRMIGADLCTSEEAISGRLRWAGDESGDLGFPFPDGFSLPDSISDLDQDHRK